MSRRVEAYNAALREVSAVHGVPCLPLHDRLVTSLPEFLSSDLPDPALG